MTRLKERLPGISFRLLMLLMVWQVPKMLDLEPLNRLTVPMAAALAAAGLVMAMVTGLWKKPPMLLLLAGLAWAGGCSLLRGTLWQDLYSYVPAACAMLFCFMAAFSADIGQLKRLGRAVCLGWIGWMTVLSLTALIAAFTGTHLHQTAWNRFIGINSGDNRLYIMDFCTNAAGNLLISSLMTLALLLLTRRRREKAPLMLCLMLQLSALSLTDARTSFIALGVGVGAMSACVLYQLLPRGRTARYTASLVSAGACVVAVYLLMSFLTNLLGGHVPGYTSALLPTALADDGVVTHRTIGSGSLLTYRDDVWRGFLEFLRSEPGTLLTGTGPSALMSRIMPYVVSEQASFDHPHSIFLHLLGSYGIPGLLIAAAFLALFARSAWRLIFRAGSPLWQRLLPVPAIAVLVCELVECLTLGRVNGPVLILLFLSLGATLAADREGAAGKEKLHVAA